jgi:cell shape-determining protein MreC
MPFVSSRRILVIALGGAALLSALPQSFQTPWSGTLATVLWAPLVPGASVLAWARDWVRAPAEPYQGLPEELRTARESRDQLQGELDAVQLRVGQLESELGELSGYRPADRAGWQPRLATVIERGAGRPAGLLGIDVGTAQGIGEGDPVVVGGNQIIGMIAAGGAENRSWVIPLDDRRCGRIDAIVLPEAADGSLDASGGAGAGGKKADKAGRADKSDKARNGTRATVLVQLVPQGNRTLVGELESLADVKPGDSVLLGDAGWRPAAQGMRIGVVESEGALDANPLRRRITVRMESDPLRVARVVVKVRVSGQGQGTRGTGAAK